MRIKEHAEFRIAFDITMNEIGAPQQLSLQHVGTTRLSGKAVAKMLDGGAGL